jgi:hypothetical protein
VLDQIKYIFNMANFFAATNKPVPPAMAKAIRTYGRRQQRIQDNRVWPRTSHDYAQMEAAIAKRHRKNFKRGLDDYARNSAANVSDRMKRAWSAPYWAGLH